MTDALLEPIVPAQSVLSGDEDVRQYIREIRQYPLLTPAEEASLARRCAAGDEEALHRMVSSNLRLVVAIAREYAGRGAALLDLIQEGSIGLIIAARKFDPGRELRFSTYASKWIRQRIGRYLTDHAEVIRVPAYTAERMRKLMNETTDFQSREGRAPSAAELSQRMELSEEKVAQILQLAPEISSLDVPVGENGENALGDLIPGDEELEPQAILIRQEMKALIDSLLFQLNERQQQILRLRYGLEDGVCLSLGKIGEKLGISKERARQIEYQAIKRLNKLSAEYGLEDFLE